MFLAIAPFFLVGVGLQASPGTDWKTVQTGVGTTVVLPADMRPWYRIPSQKPASKGAPASCETYSSHRGKFAAAFMQSDIPPEENPADSEALRVDYVALGAIDMDKAKFTMIRHFASQGWPTVEFDVEPQEGSTFQLGGSSIVVTREVGTIRYRVTRTKNKDYVLHVWGGFTKEERQRICDSFRLPKETGTGPLTKWGPEPKSQSLANSLVEVWSPIEFKEQKSGTGPDHLTEMKSYLAELGCEKLVIGVLDLPPGTEDQLDDSFLEQIIQSTASEAQLRNARITLDAVKTYRANNRDFHYTTGHTPQADVRLDVTVAENRVVIFTVAVPHGMLESADIKRFIASYTVK